MQDPTDAGRRRFIGWSAGIGGSFLWGGTAVGLASCGGSGGDGAAAGSAGSAASQIPVIDRPTRVSMSVQARKVEWVTGKTPASANAWVYAADGVTASSGVLPNHLGPTINVRRGSPCTVAWSNTIPASPSDPGLLADPPINPPPVLAICGRIQLQSPVGLTTHLHGARVNGSVDGWPLTPMGFAGNPYGFPTAQEFTYPNAQRSTMLWYHDHAMDRTGRHVHSGLAGMYFVRDAHDDALLALIGGAERELPLVIQDRLLTDDGTGINYAGGIADHVSDEAGGRPEFLGTTLFVNGHPSATLTLERRVWRLRILNGSNTRTIALALCDPDALETPTRQIWYTHMLRIVGADGGLIGKSVTLNDTAALVIAPAQRRDVLLDLTALPASVSRVRLVNVNLKLFASSSPRLAEGIFTIAEESLLLPSSPLFTPVDLTLYGALDADVSDVATIELAAAAGSPAVIPTPGAIDSLLAAAASDDDFVWNGVQLAPPAGATFGPNRLVLLMTNTAGYTATEVGSGVDGWSEVQIFELQAGGTDWQVPFAVDLASATNPAPGAPSATPQSYALGRHRFFAAPSHPDIAVAKAYPPVHAPVVVARAGTYERWYVANIGNSQPLRGDDPGTEMHPFHIHMVNAVVTKRWALDGAAVGGFVELIPADADLNGIARQDTVLVPSGQLVEMVVYYPTGVSGDYAFHCHLLEHEDFCMMSHFHVTAA
jgi:FtsP/CotA-like multicopper oxidase with cupredoxin domain